MDGSQKAVSPSRFFKTVWAKLPHPSMDRSGERKTPPNATSSPKSMASHSWDGFKIFQADMMWRSPSQIGLIFLKNQTHHADFYAWRVPCVYWFFFAGKGPWIANKFMSHAWKCYLTNVWYCRCLACCLGQVLSANPLLQEVDICGMNWSNQPAKVSKSHERRILRKNSGSLAFSWLDD